MGGLFGTPQAAQPRQQQRAAQPRQQQQRAGGGGNVNIKDLKTKIIRDSALASGYATSNKGKARAVLQEMERDFKKFRDDPVGRQDKSFIREQEEAIRDIKSLL